MSIIIHTLPDVLAVETKQIREILRCLLHTVLFCRALGLVHPIDVDMSLCDTTHVRVASVA